jgi:hypothetical protein
MPLGVQKDQLMQHIQSMQNMQNDIQNMQTMQKPQKFETMQNARPNNSHVLQSHLLQSLQAQWRRRVEEGSSDASAQPQPHLLQSLQAQQDMNDAFDNRERQLRHQQVHFQQPAPGLDCYSAFEEDSRQAAGMLSGLPASHSTEEDFEEDNAESMNPDHFKIDLDAIAKGEDKRTTCMIRNIPNQYTQRSLASTIDQQSPDSLYNFLYVPVNYRNRRNVGYAFINFEDPKHIIPFFHSFHGSSWSKFNSEKICAIAYARLQGLDSLIAHFSTANSQERKAQPLFRLTGKGRALAWKGPFGARAPGLVRDHDVQRADGHAANGEENLDRIYLDQIWDDGEA